MHFLRPVSVFSISILLSVVGALPTAAPSPALDLASAERDLSSSFKRTGCDLSRAVLPQSGGPTALAGPDAGLRLTRVVLGRGTQNYTCIDSLETTIPTGGGAVAALYDASCLAATFPALLHELPNALVALSSGTARQRITRDAALVGHHFFAPNFATPVFDFRTKPGQTGIFTGARDAGIPAAAGAARGGPPDQQFGAVDWLRLKTLPGQSVGYQLVYRIHTAGGKPPPNCKGRPSTITIEYATEYWLYS